jgi:hypothetical protein
LPVGTRVCVYWSNATGNCLFPGTIDTLDGLWPETSGMVQVILDDGDERQVEMTKVRLLPPNYQHVGTFYILLFYCLFIYNNITMANLPIHWILSSCIIFQNMILIPLLHYADDVYLPTALKVDLVITIQNAGIIFPHLRLFLKQRQQLQCLQL